MFRFHLFLYLLTTTFVHGGTYGLVVTAAEDSAAKLHQGDVLMAWRLFADSSPGTESAVEGTFKTPFDLWEVEHHQAPRGRLKISGLRGGEPIMIEMPAGRWGIQSRPRLSAAESRDYDEALQLAEDGKHQDAAAALRSMAEDHRRAGHHETASWLWFKTARMWIAESRWNEARPALDAALELAESADLQEAAAWIEESRSTVFEMQGDLKSAMAAEESALSRRRVLEPGGLGTVRSLSLVGIIHGKNGDLQAAEASFSRALKRAEEIAPESQIVSGLINNLGIVARKKGDLSTAEELLQRDLELTKKLEPGSLNHALTLQNLGLVAKERGDLSLAQTFQAQALEIREQLQAEPGLAHTASYYSLATIAIERGDLETAERFLLQALSITERLAPRGAEHSLNLAGMGALAFYRQDLDGAAEWHQQALKLLEKILPGGFEVATSLNNLAQVAAAAGDLALAESYMRRAVSLEVRLAPRTASLGIKLTNLGDVLLQRGDLAEAESAFGEATVLLQEAAPESLAAARLLIHRSRLALDRGQLADAEAFQLRANEIFRRWAPGSTDAAASAFALGEIYDRQGRLEEALAQYRLALNELEAQNLRLGGDPLTRAEFAAQHARYYHTLLQRLVDRGQVTEAFQVLERYRARIFLDLLAERDLLFTADLSPELDRQRRIIRTTYDRLFSALVVAEGEPERQNLADQLADVRRQQDALTTHIRAESPRLASLQYPRALDLATARSELEPGTLLLSYAVGERGSHLFALGPEPGDGLEVYPLVRDGKPLLEADLTAEIKLFRDELARGRTEAQTLRLRYRARLLSALLLAPVRERIARAERLLILADGPLHLIPFAALANPRDESQYLVELCPLYSTASMTVLAELRQRPRSSEAEVIAFGDPQYPERLAEDQRKPAILRDRSLAPLPASRLEMETLARLFPDRTRIYVGAEAKEERAKEVAHASYLHFACHGLYEDHSPLDSALALTIPELFQEGQDNGLLQAWEIFEQMRFDAELVTLSSCDSGAGKLLAGEGLLSLSRAFQHAGARSVLASLWPVSDTSTSELMRHLYHHLKAGMPKAEALREAQLKLLHSPSTSHPFHWAAFTLNGDGS